MTSLAYMIYNIKGRNERVILVESQEVAHELCIQHKNYAYKPVVMATSVSEAQTLIRQDATGGV